MGIEAKKVLDPFSARIFAEDPDELLTLVADLKNIWIAGNAYIGDLPAIFESYQYVTSSKKEAVKQSLMKIYEEMKVVHPQIQSIDWDK